MEQGEKRCGKTHRQTLLYSNFWSLKYCVPKSFQVWTFWNSKYISSTVFSSLSMIGALTKPLIDNQVALNAITFTICNYTTIIVYNDCAFFLNLSTHYIYFVKFIWKKKVPSIFLSKNKYDSTYTFAGFLFFSCWKQNKTIKKQWTEEFVNKTDFTVYSEETISWF